MFARLAVRCLGSLIMLSSAAVARGETPPGIVFESEAICEPKTAWQKDRSSPGHWTLWTKEAQIERKRSGGRGAGLPERDQGPRPA